MGRGSRDGSRKGKDGEGLWGELRVTKGKGNQASPNIYSGFYKPPLMSREDACLPQRRHRRQGDSEVVGGTHAATLLINVIEEYITETEKEM